MSSIPPATRSVTYYAPIFALTPSLFPSPLQGIYQVRRKGMAYKTKLKVKVKHSLDKPMTGPEFSWRLTLLEF